MKRLKNLLAAMLPFFVICAAFAEESCPVVVNEIVVMRLFDQDGASAKLLAKEASQIIEKQIEAQASVNDLNIKETDFGYAIFWGSDMIVEVTREQARKHNSEPEALAGLWLKNIKEAGKIKPLPVSLNKLTIAMGDSDFITVGGEGPIELDYDASNLEISTEDDILIFTPLRPVNSKVVIKRKRQKASVLIVSKYRAGEINSNIDLVVTGTPASPEVIKSGLLYRLSDAVTLRPGASLYLAEELQINSSLFEGDKMKIPVKIILEGSNYITVEGVVIVSVVNSSLKWPDEGELWVSNRPELVDCDGVLFRASLDKEDAARFMYSHKNISDYGRKLRIICKNLSDKPADLLFRNASAGPGKYEIYTGHTAAVRYISLFMAKGGYLLRIPPFSEALLSDVVINSNLLFSGICDFNLIDGERVEVRVETFPSFASNLDLKDINEPFDPFKIHPHGIFPSSFIDIEHSFKTSDEIFEIEVGKWPWVIDAATGEPNTGNFGMIYSIDAELVNDAQSPVAIDVTFTPLNGTSQGTIVFDGKLIETPVLQKDEEYVLDTIRLKGNEVQKINLLTIPEASSCYPIKFTLRRGR